MGRARRNEQLSRACQCKSLAGAHPCELRGKARQCKSLAGARPSELMGRARQSELVGLGVVAEWQCSLCWSNSSGNVTYPE